MKAKTKRIMTRIYSKYSNWLWFLLGVAIVVLLTIFLVPKAQATPPAKYLGWVNQGPEYAGEYGECIPDASCGTEKGTQTADLLQDQKCQDINGIGTNGCVKNATQTITVGTTSQGCEVKEVECPKKVDICHWEVCEEKEKKECTDKWKIIKDESAISPDFLYEGEKCEGKGCREAWCEANQPKDEPTEVSTPCTQNCGTPPTFAGSSTEAPQCGEKAPAAAVNPHVYRKGDVAIVRWWNTEGNQAHIYYKQVNAADWQYSITTANTGYAEIHGLGTMDISFAVQQVNGCSGGVSVISPVIVDGATDGWVLFR